MHYIAVYGSLKKGFYNHPYFNMGDIVARGKVSGAMYQAGSFPRLCAGEDSLPKYTHLHDVEIYKVDDATYQSIEGMELGAGYYAQDITVYDNELVGHDCTIFYSYLKNCNLDNELVEYSKETVPSAWIGQLPDPSETTPSETITEE